MSGIFSKTHLFILGAILVIGTVYKKNVNTALEKEFICSDGIWYYSYLPAVFIYHDLSFSFLEKAVEENYKTIGDKSTLKAYRGQSVNKFFFGEALLASPFFFAAHCSSKYFGYKPDGFSLPYQLFFWVGALFYLCLGNRFSYKIFCSFGIPDWIASLTCILMTFGTNLFYYSFYEPSFSHVFSFFAVSGLLWHMRCFFNSHKIKNYLFACIFMSIVLMIRPVNLIILFALPLMAGNLQTFKSGIIVILRKPLAVLGGLLIFLPFVMVQMLLWHIQTGHWFVWSYGNERFYFDRPHILEILFSYKKGLFVYTPLTFLSLFSFLFLFKKEKFLILGMLIFLIVSAYILSSWWSWWYSMSFGMRTYIEFFPLFFLFFAFLAYKIRRKILLALLFIISFLLVAMNQIQCYQYRNFILHWENMDKKKYWAVFLKTSDRYKGALWSVVDTISVQSVNKYKTFDLVFGNSSSNFTGGSVDSSKKVKTPSGRAPEKLDENGEYSGTLIFPTDSLPKNQGLIIKVYLQYLFPENNSQGKLVVSVQNKENVSYYKNATIPEIFSNVKSNEWDSLVFECFIGEVHPGSFIKVYVHNPLHKVIYLANFKVEFYKP